MSCFTSILRSSIFPRHRRQSSAGIRPARDHHAEQRDADTYHGIVSPFVMRLPSCHGYS